MTGAAPSDTAPLRCTDCAAWNAPRAPFRIYGNTSYVGVEGLSVASGEIFKRCSPKRLFDVP